MFILDSLMISGIQWALKTALTAAEAEMNDDTALRDQLLEAEMRREMGEISDNEFEEIERDLLARIREIKERREGAGPLGMGAEPMDTSSGSTFRIEAEMSGDFHAPGDRPQTTVIAVTPASVEEVVATPIRQRRPRKARARTMAGSAGRETTRRSTGKSGRQRKS